MTPIGKPQREENDDEGERDEPIPVEIPEEAPIPIELPAPVEHP